MKSIYTKFTNKNNVEVTLFLELDNERNHNGNYILSVVDCEGNESDEYDYYFTEEHLAINEYNLAVLNAK